MIEIDYTVFIQIANLLVLIFLLNKILFKPIRTILMERDQAMGGLSSDIRDAKGTVQRQEDALKAGLDKARAKGTAERDALTQQGEEEEKGIIAKINAKAQKDLEQMRASVAKDVAKAETALSAEVNAFALAIGEKILGRSVS